MTRADINAYPAIIICVHFSSRMNHSEPVNINQYLPLLLPIPSQYIIVIAVLVSVRRPKACSTASDEALSRLCVEIMWTMPFEEIRMGAQNYNSPLAFFIEA